MKKSKPFDPAEHLDSSEVIAAYLTEAFETEDVAYISKAIGAVARSQGMTAVAEKTGLSRENLYRARWRGEAGVRHRHQGSSCARIESGGAAAEEKDEGGVNFVKKSSD